MHSHSVLQHVPASTQKPPAEKSNVIDLRTYRQRVTRWAAGSGLGGIALAAAIYGLYVNAADLHLTPVSIPTTAASGEMNEATQQRYEGMSYCAIRDYKQCLVYLDRARALDPGGEAGWPRVQVARAIAEQAVATPGDGGGK